MKILVWTQGLLIVALFIILAVVKGCYSDLREEKDIEITKVKMEKQLLEQQVNKQGDTITTQKAVETQSQETIKKISGDAFNLRDKYEKLVKKVRSFSRQETELRIDSVPVPYVDTLAQKIFADSIERNCAVVIQYMRDSTIRVPATARDSTAEYVADLTATKNGISINTLSVIDTNYSRIIEKKGGFFRKVMTTNDKGVSKMRLKFHVPKSIEFQTLHTNNMVKVKGQTSLVYTPKAKLKWVVPTLAAIGGFILGSQQ